MGPAGAMCRTCGTELRHGARFCDGCGAPAPEPREQAEFKQVTVLFADVVGSLAIASAVGAERLREMMADVFGRAATITRRYGGTVDKFTGDGIMALFGAPVALEDHAFRACLAALDIQEQMAQLAGEVQRRDGVELRLRVGLNSGRVIAGEIGSGPTGYTAVGEQVGLAQRMESVAPPGGVMLSESTARLVEHATVLRRPEWVHVKGAEEPLPARRLLGAAAERGRIGRREPTLVGRTWEMNTVAGILDRGDQRCRVRGRGGRATRYRQEPHHARGRDAGHRPRRQGVHRLLRIPYPRGPVPCGGATAADGVRDQRPRRARGPRAGAGPASPTPTRRTCCCWTTCSESATPTPRRPTSTADARRRRLAALLNAAALTRTAPALYVIEDVHWIDEVSESMLAEFLTVVAADPVTGADHLPPRIPGRAVADTGRSDDLAGAAELGARPQR